MSIYRIEQHGKTRICEIILLLNRYSVNMNPIIYQSIEIQTDITFKAWERCII